MKIIYLLLLICIIAACKPKPPKTNGEIKVKPAKVLSASYKTTQSLQVNARDTTQRDIDTINYADYYIVVADTGLNYNELRSKMFDLKKSLNIPIDTMGRSYNKAKDLIALSDKDEDEIYAGEYYPRRSVSDFLSLEYLNQYKSDAKEKTIALVRGIYENKTSADSALLAMGQSKPAFAFKAKVYIGCMH
ncbi:hypothetical protein G7092_29745 [Mucilaginibacter sp. HC2]|uniref:hypothetical protein n=1 Tax=Mucilaginibacter inviolabilis TaxID=2714892 RepID=UPI00140E032B|nr:hypothetical protein [Mucilaginibacter inviolabilis]NHA08021.1 hypothetical protein [Mucilaginibacter inviolabilis]